MAKKRRKKTKRSGAMTRRGVSDDQLYENARQALDSGSTDRAALLFRQFVARNADDTQRVIQLAMHARENNAHQEAILLLEPVVERVRDFITPVMLIADSYFLRGRIQESLDYALKAIEIDPRQTAAYHMAAKCYEWFEEPARQRELLERALAIVPDDPNVSTQMAAILAKDGETERAYEMLERVLAIADLPINLKRPAEHQLAKLLDRNKQFKQAFEAYERCGEVTRQFRQAKVINRSLPYLLINGYRSVVSPELLERYRDEHRADREHQKTKTKAPGFLVGFPRSGTTMLEQVIAAHPNVESSDEEPMIPQCMTEALRLCGTNDLGEMMKALRPEMVRTLRAHFWQLIRRFSDQASQPDVFFLDKNPMNLIHIAFINAIFPDARVLIALRDPRDVCLSCLMQDFNINEAMIHFTSFESTTKMYDALMGWYLHVKPMLTVPFLEVRYEDTVRDLEWQSKRVYEHLGLEWSEDVLHYYEKTTGRRITTPSFEAVRQPVNTTAVRRWERYRESLEPHLPRLQPYVEAFGFADDDAAQASPSPPATSAT